MTTSRRDFIKQTVAGAAGIGVYSALSASQWSRVRGANNEVRVAVIGFRSKGKHHIQMLRKIPGVRVVALCDADKDILDRQVREFKKRKETVKGYQDFRRVLDDMDIDAISTATPNHWHALVTVWACQAGKDVYVEKPVSHNIWEGRQMVDAAHKYNRIVQSGTMKRSDRGIRDAIRFLQSGDVGKILWARGFCYKRRGSIGKVDGPRKPPSSVDYNLWCGPVPMEKLARKRLHYDWHWVWPTGNGDLGNQGVHEVDLARWALGETGLPRRVLSVGGRVGYDDDGTTPNTQIAFFDYEKAPLIFEVRGLPMKSGVRAMDHYRGTRIGIVVQCEGGYFVGGGGGGWLYDTNGKKMKQFKGGGAGGHHANWIDAIRKRDRSILTCDVAEGHYSSALCHMANISHRVGNAASTGELGEKLRGNREMTESFERMKEHLGRNGLDLEKTRLTQGAALEFDRDRESFEGQHSYAANKLVSREYRRPFVVPVSV